MEPKLQLRLNPQIFHMGLLQQREVCLSNAGKSENMKDLRIWAKVINKKIKADQTVIASNEPSSPSALIWDGANYSCEYDALFTDFVWYLV